MDNQPPTDPNQLPPRPLDRSRPVFQPRPTQQAATPPRPVVPPVNNQRPTYGPPPGYQPVSLPASPAQPAFEPYPQPQLLPRPVVPGQAPGQKPFAPPPNNQPAPTTPAKAAKKLRWLWLLVGLIVVAMLAFAGLQVAKTIQARPTKAAQAVTDSFVADLQKNDPAGAYLLTSDTYQKTYSDEYFKKIVNQVSGGLQGPASVVGRNISKTSPQRATLVYKVPTQSATQYVKITLEQLPTWQITSFAASTVNPGTSLSQ